MTTYGYRTPTLALRPEGEFLPRKTKDLCDNRMAVCIQCLHLWDVNAALPHMKRLGAKRARVYSTWALSEKQPGVYEFDWLDEIVNRLIDGGTEPYFCMAHGNPLYSRKSAEAGGIGHYPAESPESLAAYARYAGKLAAHFQGRVTWYEVFNEPDCVGESWVGDVDENTWHTQYNRLFLAAAEAVLSSNPDARMVWGALARPDMQTRFPHVFDDPAVAARVSAVSYHDYHVLPEDMNAARRAAVKEYLRRRLPNVQLWMDEGGIPSEVEPGTIGALAQMDHLTERVQCIWLARRMFSYLSDRSVDMVAYFRLADHPRFDNYVVNHYGLLRADLTPKPSWGTYARIAALFGTGHIEPCENRQRFAVENEECFESAEKHVRMLYRPEQQYSDETLANTRLQCFDTPLGVMLAYWNLCAPNERFEDGRAAIRFVPRETGGFRHPVALDVLSGYYYAIKQEACGETVLLRNVPYTNYPFILMERKTLEMWSGKEETR